MHVLGGYMWLRMLEVQGGCGMTTGGGAVKYHTVRTYVADDRSCLGSRVLSWVLGLVLGVGFWVTDLESAWSTGVCTSVWGAGRRGAVLTPKC